MRENAEAGCPGALFEEGTAFRKEVRIAVELVDQKGFQPGTIFCGQDVERAGDRGDDAATMDVANQDRRNAGRRGEAHVGEVAVAKVDLAGAAGTFDQHDIAIRGKAAKAVENGRHELLAVPEIVARRHAGLALALDDDLRARGSLGLQQHRVHVDGWLGLGGTGLQGLGTADLAAIGGDGGVVRHVLRLEGADLHSPVGQGAGKAGDDEGLAHIGAGAHQHDGTGHAASQMTWA